MTFTGYTTASLAGAGQTYIEKPEYLYISRRIQILVEILCASLNLPVAMEQIEKSQKCKPHPPGTPGRLKEEFKVFKIVFESRSSLSCSSSWEES